MANGNPIADPAPLGLSAFALTAFVLSAYNAGIVKDPTGVTVILGPALALGGLAQLLAGMWEFKRNNIFTATAFTSYGAFWLAEFYNISFHPIPAAAAGSANGVFLLGWTIFTAFMTIGAMRIASAVFAVFVGLTLTLLLLTLANFGVVSATVGGYAGIVTAGLAEYTAAGILLNTMIGRAVLPLGVPAAATAQGEL